MASRFSKFDKFLVSDATSLNPSDQDFLRALDAANLQPDFLSAPSLRPPADLPPVKTSTIAQPPDDAAQAEADVQAARRRADAAEANLQERQMKAALRNASTAPNPVDPDFDASLGLTG